MAQRRRTPSRAATGLHRNAVGLLAAIMLSATIMGPAVSTYFNTQFTAQKAGAALPFVYLVSLIAALIVANGVAEMARKLPAAGAFYTYVVRGIGPKAGFLTGTLMFLGYSLLEPAELALIGSWIHDVFSRFGYDVSWLIIAAIFWVTTFVLSIRGIRISMETALIAFGIEVAIILILCVFVLAKGGAEGINVQPFDPGQSPSGLSGIALGMVFGILSFVGFEGAATLGEEIRQPARQCAAGHLRRDDDRRHHLPVRDLGRDARLRRLHHRDPPERHGAVRHAGQDLRARLVPGPG